ncbi:GNAT family N-acetyltransferase [Corynebacterium variabile]|uniref:GNAT family N-acetyltransferase n=1 Tax=Corynebacterium variabile TaxID=1727 RepID=UPI000200129C|nr:GNAT family N-acetyltransferase [Corynebacterium variabile]
MAVGRDGAVRPLTQQELDTPEFARLIWLASGAGTEKLKRLIRDVPSEYLVHGVIVGERVVAFVAFDPDTDPVVIRYIAVEEDSQHRGLGGALVAAVTQRATGRSVYAETDDDAVEFYRRSDFRVVAKPRDPCWPERQRYGCVLPSASRI